MSQFYAAIHRQKAADPEQAKLARRVFLRACAVEMRRPRAHVVSKPVKSKSTWTCHKSQVKRKLTCKRLQAESKRKFTGKKLQAESMQAKLVPHGLCEPRQSKCTRTSHKTSSFKTSFYKKKAGTESEHLDQTPALTPNVRTIQDHSVLTDFCGKSLSRAVSLEPKVTLKAYIQGLQRTNMLRKINILA